MKILAVESSASSASVSLHENENMLAEFSVNIKLKHSHTLMPMVESLFKCSKQKISDVDLFACSTGPGSFTGIRVGISSVKGMAMALSRPCVGVSSLRALACSLENNSDKYIICVMDAKCDRFYFASFKKTKNTFQRISKDSILEIKDLIFKIHALNFEKFFLLGDAAYICYNKLKLSGFKNEVVLPNENLNSPYSRGVAKISREKFLKGETTNAGALTASYFCVSKAQKELELKSSRKEINNAK